MKNNIRYFLIVPLLVLLSCKSKTGLSDEHYTVGSMDIKDNTTQYVVRLWKNDTTYNVIVDREQFKPSFFVQGETIEMDLKKASSIQIGGSQSNTRLYETDFYVDGELFLSKDTAYYFIEKTPD